MKPKIAYKLTGYNFSRLVFARVRTGEDYQKVPRGVHKNILIAVIRNTYTEEEAQCSTTG